MPLHTHAFILNAAPPSGAKLTKSSMQFLRHNGSTVIETPITFRPAYMAAMTVGKSGPEVEKGSVARTEIDALWAAVVSLISDKATS